MDSLKLAEFLFDRIEETIDCKEYIAEINIDYTYAEYYGNEHIKISYVVDTNDSYESLTFDKQEALFRKAPHYIFTLSTNKSNDRYNENKKLLRIFEFRRIYESLISYAVLQLGKHLNPGTPIKVKGTDLWPEANYSEKYLLKGLRSKYNYIMDSYFERDARQWSQLHQLAEKSRKIYKQEKKQFTITDIEINDLFRISLDSIRFVLLKNNVPIRLKEVKTIDEVYIHTIKLIEALKKEITSEYKQLLTYLYDNYLPAEKEKIIIHQQAAFLQDFIIQKGDILQLNDRRVVMAKSVSIDLQNIIKVEYIILKTDLQPGERTRVIEIEDISFVLKEQYFLEFVKQVPVKNISHLSKWMEKRKMKLAFIPFIADLTQKLPEAIEYK